MRTWDAHERARGARAVIDYDCAPTGALVTPAANRLDVLNQLTRLSERATVEHDDDVQRTVSAHAVYLRAVLGERLDLDAYVRATQGCSAAGWNEHYVVSVADRARKALADTGVTWGANTSRELTAVEGPIDIHQAREEVQAVAASVEPVVRALTGTSAPFTLIIETVDVDDYWSYWLDGAGSQARLRFNTRQATFTQTKLAQFAQHELLGHALQCASYAQAAADTDVPWVRTLTVHLPYQTLLEGLATALPLFATPEDHLLVARTRLAHYQHLVRAELHRAINQGATVSDCADHARARAPWMTSAEIADALADRSNDPLLRTYLWAYPAGTDWFVNLADHAPPADHPHRAAHRLPAASHSHRPRRPMACRPPDRRARSSGPPPQTPVLVAGADQATVTAGTGGRRHSVILVGKDDPMPDDLLTARTVADRYVDDLVTLDPIVATNLGLPDGADRFPDLSPAGIEARAGLQRQTLARLADLQERAAAAAGPAGPAAAAGPAGPASDGAAALERRCARLLTERLTAALALHDAGEPLRSLSNVFSPVQSVRHVFTLMPTATTEDWQVIAARLDRVPEALAGYRQTLSEGMARDLPGGPAQVDAVVEQLGQWLGAGPSGWFSEFVASAPQSARPVAEVLRAAAQAADLATARLRDWLADSYGPHAHAHGRDPVGAERYALAARHWTGADLDLAEVYAWGWQEYARLDAELRAEAVRVLPGATPREVMGWLDEQGPAVEGVEAVRDRLQQMLDETVTALDCVHFDFAEPVRRVEAMIAPEGSAAAPYYTMPALDFSRPGRTWLPTLGRDRFPLWDLVSTWYHEGVPGHHLQLAHWVYVCGQLSRYQTTLGLVGANVEGWALYAERLMDELGFLTEIGARIGYLDAQRLRAVRVVIDIGMHLRLPLPADQGVPEPFHPGELWTPRLAREFLGLNSGYPADYLHSELIRYLGGPGQAISYKLGERAWLTGREAARQAHAVHGREFDEKAWHMAALSQGSLGLDDLVAELSAL